MPVPFQHRRNPSATRLTLIPLNGELYLDTDIKKTFMGDGATTGGIPTDGNQITTTSSLVTYLIQAGDVGKHLIYTGAGNLALTMSQANSSGGVYFPAQTYVIVENQTGLYQITITPATSTINGAASLTLYPGDTARVVSDGTNYWAILSRGAPIGQLPGTATNDLASSGNVGEFIYSASANQSATVTITNASPAVVTWTGHGLLPGTGITFTTTGSLPTGLAISTNYYIIPTGLTANSFQISATPFGTAINTSSSGSGTQTGKAQTVAAATGTGWNLGAIQVTAGNWQVSGGGLDAAPTSGTNWTIGINLTSATVPALLIPIIAAGSGPYSAINMPAANNGQILPTGMGWLSVNALTTVYLIGKVNYTGTASASNAGWIGAQRIR